MSSGGRASPDVKNRSLSLCVSPNSAGLGTPFATTIGSFISPLSLWHFHVEFELYTLTESKHRS